MKTIRQKVYFKSNPHEVFELLMDSRKHAKFTSSEAFISRKVGGKISAYGGYIEGENLEIVPDRKIVQKWRGSEWPEGAWSTAIFELKKKGPGTELVFTQRNVPDSHSKMISEGWKEHYWDKMKKFLEK